jgi:hypothetical protein
VTEVNPQDLADRYIAQWTEPDAAARRAAIESLWAQDAVHVLQPPTEIRTGAAALGFDHTTLEARGHDAIETRVTRSYERWVAKEGLTFRPAGDAVRLHDLVKFTWQTVSADATEVLGGGLEILLLTPDGRIRTDYMFPA